MYICAWECAFGLNCSECCRILPNLCEFDWMSVNFSGSIAIEICRPSVSMPFTTRQLFLSERAAWSRIIFNQLEFPRMRSTLLQLIALSCRTTLGSDTFTTLLYSRAAVIHRESLSIRWDYSEFSWISCNSVKTRWIFSIAARLLSHMLTSLDSAVYMYCIHEHSNLGFLPYSRVDLADFTGVMITRCTCRIFSDSPVCLSDADSFPVCRSTADSTVWLSTADSPV